MWGHNVHPSAVHSCWGWKAVPSTDIFPPGSEPAQRRIGGYGHCCCELFQILSYLWLVTIYFRAQPDSPSHWVWIILYSKHSSIVYCAPWPPWTTRYPGPAPDLYFSSFLLKDPPLICFTMRNLWWYYSFRKKLWLMSWYTILEYLKSFGLKTENVCKGVLAFGEKLHFGHFAHSAVLHFGLSSIS